MTDARVGQEQELDECCTCGHTAEYHSGGYGDCMTPSGCDCRSFEAYPEPRVTGVDYPTGGDPAAWCECGHHESNHANYANMPRACNQTGCGCVGYSPKQDVQLPPLDEEYWIFIESIPANLDSSIRSRRSANAARTCRERQLLAALRTIADLQAKLEGK